MGLLDVLTGMRNGPRGFGGGGRGMSPITMALLGLIKDIEYETLQDCS
jgi:hypothetical protein